jgi:hypothetical protein
MPSAPKLLAAVSCPEITWSTTSVIRWELKCEPGSFIEIPLGVFLAIAVGAENEDDFRAQMWLTGKITHRQQAAARSMKAKA